MRVPMRLTPLQLLELSDDELMVYACKGDQSAMKLCCDIVDIAAVWDDLVDGDKTVERATIDRVFTKALIDVPANPFFHTYSAQLLPIFRSAILNWQIANYFETNGCKADVEIGHTLRYAPGDVVTTVVSIIGGMEWAVEVGPELRRRVQKDALSAYLEEHGHAGS